MGWSKTKQGLTVGVHALKSEDGCGEWVLCNPHYLGGGVSTLLESLVSPSRAA